MGQLLVADDQNVPYELPDLFVSFSNAQSLVDVDVPVVVDPLRDERHFRLGFESHMLVTHELSQALSRRVGLVGKGLQEQVFACLPAGLGLRCELHRGPHVQGLAAVIGLLRLPLQRSVRRLDAEVVGILQVDDAVGARARALPIAELLRQFLLLWLF